MVSKRTTRTEHVPGPVSSNSYKSRGCRCDGCSDAYKRVIANLRPRPRKLNLTDRQTIEQAIAYYGGDLVRAAARAKTDVATAAKVLAAMDEADAA